MIRFSAGLVVVAIGVLIGGVATSKLSLVYVAIAVSAVALVALAIGVALKREELFGGEPGLAPAGAGAGSGMPVGQSADTGDVRGSNGDVRKDQQPIRPKVPGPATIAFEAAAAASAAPTPAMAPIVAAPIVAAPTVAAPSAAAPPVPAPPVGSPVGSRVLDNPPLGQRRPAFGQTPSREADSAADWETRLPQPLWSSGDQVRPTPTWTPRESTPKEPQPGATPGAPRDWGSPDQPPAPPTRTGSGIDAPSWFDRLNQPVADRSARTDTDPAKTQPARPSPRRPSWRRRTRTGRRRTRRRRPTTPTLACPRARPRRAVAGRGPIGARPRPMMTCRPRRCWPRRRLPPTLPTPGTMTTTGPLATRGSRTTRWMRLPTPVSPLGPVNLLRPMSLL